MSFNLGSDYCISGITRWSFPNLLSKTDIMGPEIIFYMESMAHLVRLFIVRTVNKKSQKLSTKLKQLKQSHDETVVLS